MDGDDLTARARVASLRCAICDALATCVGRYENAVCWEPACDECCGHVCEDGRCYSIDDDPKRCAAILAEGAVRQ